VLPVASRLYTALGLEGTQGPLWPGSLCNRKEPPGSGLTPCLLPPRSLLASGSSFSWLDRAIVRVSQRFARHSLAPGPSMEP